jgi:hypothetical protein
MQLEKAGEESFVVYRGEEEGTDGLFDGPSEPGEFGRKMPKPTRAYPPTIKKGARRDAQLRPMGSVKEIRIKPRTRVPTPPAMTFFPRLEKVSPPIAAAGSRLFPPLFFLPIAV